MGKVRKSRRLKNEARLAQKTSSRRICASQDSNIQLLLSELAAVNSATRVQALSAVSSLIEQNDYRTAFLKERLVKTILARSLSDTQIDVRLAAYDLLIKLIQYEGYDVAIFLYRNDVFSQLAVHLEQATLELHSWLETGLDSKVVVVQTMTKIFALLAAMADKDESIFDYVARNFSNTSELCLRILEFFLTLQREVQVMLTELASTAAELTNILSEDNPAYISSGSLERIDNLLSAQTAFSAGIRSHLLGVKYNLVVAGSHMLSELKPILISLDEIINGLVCNSDINNGGHKADIAVQAALELLTSLSESIGYCIREEKMQTENEEGIEISSELDDTLMDKTSSSDLEALEICSHLLNRVIPLLVRMTEAPSLQLSALAALNNVCWTVHINGAQLESWPMCCRELFERVTNFIENEPSPRLLSFALGILWCASTVCADITPPKERSLDIIFRCVDSEEALLMDRDVLLMNAVGLCATIARAPDNIMLTRRCGDFFMDILVNARKHSPQVIIDALNAVFDVFGDAEFEYDLPVFVSGDYLRKLTSAKGAIKAQLRNIKGSDEYGELLRASAEEALSNYARFLDYKANERRLTEMIRRD